MWAMIICSLVLVLCIIVSVDMHQKLSLGSLIWRSTKKWLSVVLWILSMFINIYLDLDIRAKTLIPKLRKYFTFHLNEKVKENMWLWGNCSSRQCVSCLPHLWPWSLWWYSWLKGFPWCWRWQCWSMIELLIPLSDLWKQELQNREGEQRLQQPVCQE